jgi:NitT/TauT family transport system ATP-binding protein
LRRKKPPDAAGLVERALGSVGLDDAMDRYPWQLSGGMQQRVAIARALAYQPRILLMDEPFASVDAQTRADLEDLVLAVRRQYEVTIVFVTHDIDEAVYLSDRVVVLTPSPTRVQEVLEVSLPHPRDQVETKELTEFARLRAHVWRSIKRPDGGLSARLGPPARLPPRRCGAPAAGLARLRLDPAAPSAAAAGAAHTDPDRADRPAARR